MKNILRNLEVTNNIHEFWFLELVVVRDSKVALQLNEMSLGVVNGDCPDLANVVHVLQLNEMSLGVVNSVPRTEVSLIIKELQLNEMSLGVVNF